MSTNYSLYRILKLIAVINLLLGVQVPVGQEHAILLRLQRSKMVAEIDATGGARGQGGNIMSLNPADMGTATYPSSASCVAVYKDGRYVLEKREEKTVGSPRVKSM